MDTSDLRHIAIHIDVEQETGTAICVGDNDSGLKELDADTCLAIGAAISDYDNPLERLQEGWDGVGAV